MMSMSVTMHPVWQSGSIILLVGVGSALLLQLIVHHFLPAALREQYTGLGAPIFSVIGTTYAVLLAFMATTAWDQYSAAQNLARHEADLIASAYHASFGILEPAGAAMRADLIAYLAEIIDAEWPAQIAGHTVPADQPILHELDRLVLGIAPTNMGQSNVQRFLIDTLDDVMTARRDRRLAIHGTIPDLVWMVLLSGGALMVGISFVLGAPARSLHLAMTAALVASGLLVLLLIIGLSSPFHGAVTIGPDAYAAVLAELRAAP
jgi:hypothetical protein